MQIRFLVDVVPGAGLRFEAGQSYELDSAVAYRYVNQGVAVVNAAADGGVSAGSAIQFYTQGTMPAATADNIGQTFCVVDDSGGRLLGSNGTSMVPLAAAVTEGASPVVGFGGSSRALTAADNGSTLEVASGGLTVTLPEGLPRPFRVHFLLLSGTTSFDPTGSAQVNGATSTITRAAGSNPMVTLQSRTTVNQYTITGA